MKTYPLLYKPYGERSILIEWPAKIEITILQDMLWYKEQIYTFEVQEIRLAYNSLLVVFKEHIKNFTSVINELKAAYALVKTKRNKVFKVWKIPVCYDEVFAIDLDGLSKEKGLLKRDIIKRHYEASYIVYFIGFLPGFLYLGGLNPSLFMPRKQTPRPRVQKGAVAIGGEQTGVYPIDSPGGWHIIGNSPVTFFNPTKTPPCFANAGDVIRFYPISIEKYRDIKILVEANVYQLEYDIING